jgi:uracil-DNA glycosylase family 4
MARSARSGGPAPSDPSPGRFVPVTAYRSLDALHRAVQSCTRCPRLVAYRRAVAETRKREFRDWIYWGKPVPGFGDPAARLWVVGLAPAAHGGNRTGRIFTGDSSGDWLYEALYRFGFANQPRSVSRDDGLALRDCYISAAARCAPPGNRPRPDELANCRSYLVAERRLLERVRVVVVLGRIAHQGWLQAAGWWDRLGPAGRPPFAHGAEFPLPDGVVLLSSYHPSRQNTNTGTLTRAMWYRVFRRARRLLA